MRKDLRRAMGTLPCASGTSAWAPLPPGSFFVNAAAEACEEFPLSLRGAFERVVLAAAECVRAEAFVFRGAFRFHADAVFEPGEPAVRLAARQNESAVLAADDVLRTASVRDDCGSSARKRFDDDVPEGIRRARENEEVRVRVKPGESVPRLVPCEMHFGAVLEMFPEFLEVPAVAHEHQFRSAVLFAESEPQIFQERNVLFLGDSPDEYKAHFVRSAELLPDASAAAFRAELLERNSARADLHVFFRNVNVADENFLVVFARAHHGPRELIKDAHQLQDVDVHPFRFHEHFGVRRNVRAVVADHLDSRDLRADADRPCAGARRFTFREVDRVALHKAQERTHVGNGELAVRIAELLPAENPGQKHRVAVLDDAAGPGMERASGEYCLVAVRAHIADDVPEVVRDAVHFIEVIGIECDADVLRIHGRMALFHRVAQPEERRQVAGELPEYDRWNHAGADVSRFLMRESEIMRERACDRSPENRLARVQFRRCKLLLHFFSPIPKLLKNFHCADAEISSVKSWLRL